MSKASTATKATATALMAKGLANPTQVKAMTSLLWTSAINAARNRHRRNRTRHQSSTVS